MFRVGKNTAENSLSSVRNPTPMLRGREGGRDGGREGGREGVRERGRREGA